VSEPSKKKPPSKKPAPKKKPAAKKSKPKKVIPKATEDKAPEPDDLSLKARRKKQLEDARYLPDTQYLNKQTDYRAEYDIWAHNLALLGRTNEEIAFVLEVHPRTIERWRVDYPSFGGAIKRGRSVATASVASALFMRANGFSVPEEKIFYNSVLHKVVRVRVNKYYPPDVAAAAIILFNREPTKWQRSPALVIKPEDPLDTTPIQDTNAVERELVEKQLAARLAQKERLAAMQSKLSERFGGEFTDVTAHLVPKDQYDGPEPTEDAEKVNLGDPGWDVESP
jgi:hypothetical protein